MTRFPQTRRPMQRRGAPIPAGQVQALTSDRAQWDHIVSTFGPQALATPGYIRSEVVLGSTGVVAFPIAVNQGGTTRVTEQRLQQNDAFMCTHIGVFLGKRNTAAGSPASNSLLHTFPNPRVFASATELVNVPGYFNGRLAIRVNEKVYLDALDMLSFQRVTEAQQGTAVSTVATTGVLALSAWEQNQAFKRMTPAINFNGLARNEVTLTLPEVLNLVAPANEENFACFYARGFLIQNGGATRSRQ